MTRHAILIGVVGIFVASGSVYFDAWWHLVIGRESFWIPPHLVLYGGVGLTGLGFLFQAFERWTHRASWDWPLKAWGLGVVLVFLSAPFDEVWHRIFGVEPIDSLMIIWSPPHVFALGAGIAIGVSLLAALLRARAQGPANVHFVLILLVVAATDGFLGFVLLPFNRVHHSVWGPFGAWLYYFVLVSWRLAAAGQLGRPVLTTLSAFHWLAESAFSLAHAAEGVLNPAGVLFLLPITGILVGAAGDATFIALEGLSTRHRLWWVGLVYMTAHALAINPFYNLFLFTGHYEIPPFIPGRRAFDLVTTLLMVVAGGVAGSFGGPLIAKPFRQPGRSGVVPRSGLDAGIPG